MRVHRLTKPPFQLDKTGAVRIVAKEDKVSEQAIFGSLNWAERRFDLPAILAHAVA
jgi:hypothetical protein